MGGSTIAPSWLKIAYKMVLCETNRIEYKEKLTSDLEQEAVAFLNSEGGDIFLGVSKDGSVAGISNIDSAQLKIAAKLKDNIRPTIMGLFNISRHLT